MVFKIVDSNKSVVGQAILVGGRLVIRTDDCRTVDASVSLRVSPENRVDKAREIVRALFDAGHYLM